MHKSALSLSTSLDLLAVQNQVDLGRAPLAAVLGRDPLAIQPVSYGLEGHALGSVLAPAPQGPNAPDDGLLRLGFPVRLAALASARLLFGCLSPLLQPTDKLVFLKLGKDALNLDLD